MPKNIDPGQRAQKKDARKGAAFFALAHACYGAASVMVLRAMGLPFRWLNFSLLVAAFALAVGDLVTIPAVWIVLKQRMKEIEGGELDAARKY